MLFLPAATPAGIVIVSFILILESSKEGHIRPPKDLKLGMELILDIRNPMVGSKLTLKAIFKAKKAKNRTSLEHPYFGCSNEVEILAVLTKLKRLDVLTKLKLKNKFPIVSDAKFSDHCTFQ